MWRITLLTLAIVSTSIVAFGQGKIFLVNDSAHLVYLGSNVRPQDAAYIYQATPTNPLPSGITLLVDLYGGADTTTMTYQTTIEMSAIAGAFGPRGFTSPNLPGGVTATMQVKVRESTFPTAEAAQMNGGYFGLSQIFTMRPSSTIAFNSIVNKGGTALSTWADGDFTIGGAGSGAIRVELGGGGSFAPIIYNNPSNGTFFIGSSVFLTAGVSGSATLSYQWRKGGIALPAGTNAALNLQNVTLLDAGGYDVVVTNFLGKATSAVATVQIVPSNAPSIRVNNQLAIGTVTSSVPANISMAGGFPGGVIFYTLDGSTPTTASVLYTGPFSISVSRTIRAMSLSADFSQSSEAPPINVVLPVVYSLSTSVSGSGTINVNPNSGTYVSNTVVVLTAVPSANWAFDHWTGDLTGSLNPASITMNGPRSVQAVFVQSAFPLTLSTPGGGSVTANGQVIGANTYYSVGSVVQLQATPNVGWNFLKWQGTTTSTANPFNLSMNQTQNVQAIFGTVVGINISGSGSIVMSATNPVPYGTVLTNTAVPVPGYRFVTWSGAVSGTNNPATFTVTNATPAVGALFAPSLTLSILTQPTNTSVIAGNSAGFNVEATGTAPLSFQWRKGGANISGATAASYNIPNAALSDAGNYDVVVMNGFGNALTSVVATLTVFVPAGINSGPFSQVVAAHETATFTVNAVGYPAPYYQWVFNGVDVPGANSSSLVITNVGTNNLGYYWVEVWNSYNSLTSAPVELLMSPSLQAPFTGLVAIWGKPAILSVSAWGSGPLTYQWYKSGQAVAGGTSNTLVFPSVQPSDGGLYSVVVSSPYGSITNPPAQLVVNPANISLGLYAGITIEGVPGYTYGIEYSTDLTDTNSWHSLTNLTLTQLVELWVDTSANVLTSPKRFYRVTSQ